MADTMFSLMRHRHGVPEVPNAANDISRLTYIQGVDGRDDMHLVVNGARETARSLFLPGDYAVMRDVLGRALSWGKVLTRTTNISRAVSGELTAQPYVVTVAGWWDFLQRAQVHVLLGDTSGPYAKPIGTVFPVTEWMSFVAELTNTFASTMGAQLTFAFRKLARLKLPDSLGGGYLGDEIPVVYDEKSAKRFAPMFEGIEAVDSGYLLPDRLVGQFGTRSTSVGGFINSTFLPEASIIELFPAMVDGGTEAYSPLATALGRRPVLVYRVKPWRDEPLWRNTVAKALYTPEDFEVTSTSPGSDKETERALALRQQAKARNKDLLVDQGIFAQVTLDTGDVTKVTPIPESFIHNIRGTVDDATRLNACTISLIANGGDEVDTSASAGLPILLDDQIEKHGLRLHRAQWPLVSPAGNGDEQYYRTIAAQVMQFNMMNHVLESGTVDMHYTAAAKVQQSVTTQQTTVTPALDIHHGRWFRTKVGDLSEYLGYITALQHSIVRGIDGTLSAKTTLQYVRGHYADVGSLVHRALVPVGKHGFTVDALAKVPEFIGRAVSALAPVVIPAAPPQTRATSPANYAKPETTTGKFLLFRGNRIATPFSVQHMPIDTSGETVYSFYRQRFRATMPQACILHTNAGARRVTVNSMWEAFTGRVNKPTPDFVAHIIIAPDGTICQFFDLAKALLHTPGGDNEINETSVAVEFIVPGRSPTQAIHEAHVAEGPWPSAENWLWYYTAKPDGTGPYTGGRVWARQFGPTAAQKAAFKRIAGVFLTAFAFPFTALPRNVGAPNTAIRASNPSTALAMYRSRRWAYFHHAQLDRNRTDAAGLDILEALGVG